MYKKGDLVLDLILTEPVTFMTYVSKEDGIVVLKNDRYNKLYLREVKDITKYDRSNNVFDESVLEGWQYNEMQ